MKYIKSHKIFESDMDKSGDPRTTIDKDYIIDIFIPLGEYGLRRSTQYQGPGYTVAHPDTGVHDKRIVTYISSDYFSKNKKEFTYDILLNLSDEINHYISYMVSLGYSLLKCRVRVNSKWLLIYEGETNTNTLPLSLLRYDINVYDTVNSFEIIFTW